MFVFSFVVVVVVCLGWVLNALIAIPESYQIFCPDVNGYGVKVKEYDSKIVKSANILLLLSWGCRSESETAMNTVATLS